VNKNISIYFESALRLKLPVIYINTANCLHIPLGKAHYYFVDTITPFNDGGSIFLAKNKSNLNQLLRNAGFPVSNWTTIHKDTFYKQSLAELTQNLRFPLVIKPQLNTHSGIDVVCNIKTLQQLSDCLESKFKRNPFMQIEEFQEGLKEYRILLLKNRVIGVVERRESCVIGDGQHTIEQLIINNNQKMAKNSYPILINAECQQCLMDQNLNLNCIPVKGKTIRLQYAVNRAHGGRAISLGKKIHSQNAKILSNITRLIGLDLVGLDLLCEDINKPFSQTKWFIIEANLGPGVSIHEYPDEGIKMNVSKKILMQLIYRHPFAYFLHRISIFRNMGKKCDG